MTMPEIQPPACVFLLAKGLEAHTKTNNLLFNQVGVIYDYAGCMGVPPIWRGQAVCCKLLRITKRLSAAILNTVVLTVESLVICSLTKWG